MRRTLTQIGMAVAMLMACTAGMAGQTSDGRSKADGKSGGAASAAMESSYEIGNGDVLGINVWKEDAISRSVPVRSDGKISLPLAGEMQASGLTPLQLKQSITQRLRSYITDPTVTVMVLEANSHRFNVLGRVAKPGSYELNGATTVLDAIAEAGGMVDFARQKSVYILRFTATGKQVRIPINYKDVVRGKHPDENIRLQAHDTVVVP